MDYEAKYLTESEGLDIFQIADHSTTTALETAIVALLADGNYNPEAQLLIAKLTELENQSHQLGLFHSRSVG